MIDAALKYHELGFSVLPIGEKKMPIGSWKHKQEKAVIPNGEFATALGIGICCGKVSGNLGLIDIDCKYDLTGKLFEDYKKIINEADKNLLKKLVVEKTPTGGYHFFYRCPIIFGNLKLASRYATDEEKETNKEKKKVLIETRGEGGYVQLAPTNGYKFIYKDLSQLSELTEEEQQTLFDCAKTLSQVYDEPIVKKEYQKIIADKKSPFEDWNERGDVLSLLENEGWKITLRRGSKNLMLRPGGTGKWSADYDTDKRLFFVWTQSSEFENDKAYNPTQVLTTLKFNGDYSEASKWLLSQGYGEKLERTTQPKAPKKDFSKALEFLANEKEMDDYINRWRTGTFEQGKKTGINELDKYFRFKKAQLVLNNGHDNVGKSIVLWYFNVLSALFHGWKHGIASAENKIGGIKKKIMEFYIGKNISLMNDREFELAEKFFKEHFFIVTNDELYSPEDVLAMARVLVEEKRIDYFLIDPYNSLIRDAVNFHEYDYKAISEMRLFTKQTGCGIYVNAHAVTESLRKVYGKESEFMGYPMPPSKADTEGGGKFANKADDFLTTHRLLGHPELYSVTEIYVRKVKETETGGMPTLFQKPVKLAMNENGCGFTELSQNQDPIKEYWYKQQYPDQVLIPLKPNTSFDTEPPLKVEKHHLNLNKDEVDIETERPDDTPF